MSMHDTTGVNPSGSIPSVEPYKDRSPGLIIFGVMTIMLGCLSGLMAILLVVEGVVVANTAAAISGSRLLPAMLMYLALAVALIWLGIGSARARRWARALLLIFSWSWLVVGVLAMGVMLCVLPQVFKSAPFPGPAGAGSAAAFGMFFVFAIVAVFFVLVPAVWTFFYQSRHVKATCDARDPVARWTDACPLPVLAVSLWTLSFAVTTLCMPITGNAVVPFFGTFLTGVPGSLIYVLLTAVWLYSAWSLYRMEMAGWWMVLVALCLMTASSIVTFAQRDLMEMYTATGYSQLELAQLRKMGAAMQDSLAWFVSLWAVPWIAYLIYVRRYLGPRPPGPHAPLEVVPPREY
jgi:uncharacterized membrane protein